MPTNYTFPGYVRTVTSTHKAKKVAAFLVLRSAWFECTPLPDDWFEFQTKVESADALHDFANSLEEI